MTIGKVFVESINENECFGVINTQVGDHIELKGITNNHVRRRVEDFCKLNQIVLAEFPASWNRVKRSF